MSSVTGEKLKISVFGESHGELVGCVVDGFPAGVKLDMKSIALQLRRRSAGAYSGSTARMEKDTPHLVSGVIDGVTTGAPICVLFENTDVKSDDYDDERNVMRPSHSDYPAYVKYGGFNDARGGGHFSGRLTAPLVFAGAMARQVLEKKGVYVGAHISRIGDVCDSRFELNGIHKELLDRLSQSDFSLIDADKKRTMLDEIEKYALERNSVGGEIECAVIGVPAGVGSNMFDSVESRLSSMLFSVPAVKGVQFGLGFGFCASNGVEVNDGYEIKDGRVRTLSNNNGGILGGITTGAPLVFSVAVKPTPSIGAPQHSVDIKEMKNTVLEIRGRHDACIVPRAVPVIEAVTALCVLDMLL